jgi:hypothetical protein
VSNDRIRLQRDQLPCKRLGQVGVAACPAIIEPDIAALNPAEFVELLPQRRNTCSRFRIILVRHHQHADPTHPVRLLRARREPPTRHRASKNRDEFAPSHLASAG